MVRLRFTNAEYRDYTQRIPLLVVWINLNSAVLFLNWNKLLFTFSEPPLIKLHVAFVTQVTTEVMTSLLMTDQVSQ